jgi:hypothetical protein
MYVFSMMSKDIVVAGKCVNLETNPRAVDDTEENPTIDADLCNLIMGKTYKKQIKKLELQIANFMMN